MAKHNHFGFKSFGVRFIFILALVLLTYNPAGFSVTDWLQNQWTPLSTGSAMILSIFWAVLLGLVYLGSGWLGLSLGAVVIALLLWMANDAGLLHFDNPTVNILVAEVSFALLLTLGLSWAHIRRRITGQLSTDDVDGD